MECNDGAFSIFKDTLHEENNFVSAWSHTVGNTAAYNALQTSANNFVDSLSGVCSRRYITFKLTSFNEQSAPAWRRLKLIRFSPSIADYKLFRHTCAFSWDVVNSHRNKSDVFTDDELEAVGIMESILAPTSRSFKAYSILAIIPRLSLTEPEDHNFRVVNFLGHCRYGYSTSST